MLAEVGPSNFLDQNVAIAIIGAGVAIFGYIYVRNTAKRKRKDPLADMPQRRSLAQQRNLERDMEQLLLELTEMTRQMNAQIDTKAAKLEQIIADADQAERRLRNALGEAGRADSAVEQLDAYNLPKFAPGNPSDGELNRKDADTGLGPIARHDQVYRLADDGMSIDDIAHRLDRPRGEIDLILALRRTR